MTPKTSQKEWRGVRHLACPSPWREPSGPQPPWRKEFLLCCTAEDLHKLSHAWGTMGQGKEGSRGRPNLTCRGYSRV